MDSLPIDIHSGKLLNWLISRRHCKDDWQERITSIRGQIGHAIKDMPEDEQLAKLLQGSYIHYFNVRNIVDILKDTEKDSKNMFGSYASQRMKDWQAILSAYEKDNVYLAEAAQLLQRLIQYDIPAANRAITKAEKDIEDCITRQEEYAKQSENATKEYELELEKNQIKGENFRKEFIEKTASIPAFLEGVSGDIVGLKDVVAYLRGFVAFNRPGKEQPSYTPLIDAIISKGTDLTVFEFRHGKPPTAIERPKLEYVPEVNENDEIDFGDDEIDFGGDDVIAEIAVLDEEVLSGGDGVARGDEALSVLEFPATQVQLLGELEILEVSIAHRFEQEKTDFDGDVYIAALEKRPDALRVSQDQLKAWIASIKAVQQKFADPAIKRLLKIAAIPGFIETVAEEFERLKQKEQKYKRLSDLSVTKQADAVKAVESGRKQVDVNVQTLIDLKESIEKDLTAKYKRECNIIGEIYSVLP
uniref:CDK5RAP3-like protein n=1 Tax=Panagrellus redivivus TaxID=6233 RepID=A0A7E4VCP8_PANRE